MKAKLNCKHSGKNLQRFFLLPNRPIIKFFVIDMKKNCHKKIQLKYIRFLVL